MVVFAAGVLVLGDPNRPVVAAAGLAAPPKRPPDCVVGVLPVAVGVLFPPNMSPEVDVALAVVAVGVELVFPKIPPGAVGLLPPNRPPPEADCELAPPLNKAPPDGFVVVDVEAPDAGAALDDAPPNIDFCSAGLAAALLNKPPPAVEGVVLPPALPKEKPEVPVACPNRLPEGFEAEPNSEPEAGAAVVLDWPAEVLGVPLGVPNVNDIVGDQE